MTGVQPADSTSASLLTPTNAVITLGFSEPMDTTSVQLAGCLTQKATRGCAASDPQVGGTISWSNGNRTLRFTPSVALAANKPYALTLRATAADAGGNTLAQAFDSQFRTGATGDATRPYTTLHSPSGAGVAVNASIVVQFSERMATTPTQDAFCLATTADCSAGAVAGAFIWSDGGDQLTFDPAGVLAASTTYHVRIDGTATASAGPPSDLAGNRLCSAEGTQCTADPAAAYSFSYTTAAAGTAAPYVVWSAPADGQDKVAGGTAFFDVTLSFSEATDLASVRSALILKDESSNCYRWNKGAPSVAQRCAAGDGGTFTQSGTQVVFKPTNALTNNATHSVAVDTTARDATDSTPLANLYEARFTVSGTVGRSPEPAVNGTVTYVLAPGAKFDLIDSVCSWPILTAIEARWDDPAQTLLGTGSSNVLGCMSITNAVLPLTATGGEHTLLVQKQGGGASTTVALTVVLPDALVLTTSEADGALTLGQTGVSVTVTLQKDGVVLGNAGVQLSLATQPLGCAGGGLTPASGALQQTNAAGQVSVQLAACTSAFRLMEVQALAGGGLTRSLTFTQQGGITTFMVGYATLTPTPSPTARATTTRTATRTPTATRTATPVGALSPTPTPTPVAASTPLAVASGLPVPPTAPASDAAPGTPAGAAAAPTPSAGVPSTPTAAVPATSARTATATATSTAGIPPAQATATTRGAPPAAASPSATPLPLGGAAGTPAAAPPAVPTPTATPAGLPGAPPAATAASASPTAAPPTRTPFIPLAAPPTATRAPATPTAAPPAPPAPVRTPTPPAPISTPSGP